MLRNFECDLCHKSFTHKGTYDRHLKRQTPCAPTTLAITANESENNSQCRYCFKVLSSYSNRLRHEKNTRCKQFAATITALQTKVSEQGLKIERMQTDKVKKLETKIRELETMIKQGINPMQVITTNTTNIMNTMNTINIFVINKYGHEDLSHLTDSQKLNNLRKIYMSVPSFILLKHFDKDHPENSNVYVSNLKTPYALIYNGESWVVTDRNKLLQEMYDDNYCEVIHNYKEMKAQLDDKTIDAFRRFLNDQDDDKLISKMKNDIKLILYNNRDQVISIKNK